MEARNVLEKAENATAYWTQMGLWIGVGLIAAGFALVAAMRLIQSFADDSE